MHAFSETWLYTILQSTCNLHTTYACMQGLCATQSIVHVHHSQSLTRLLLLLT